MALNQALKLMRVYHDMTQADVAVKLDVTKSYISELESGKKTPSLHVLEHYARTFDVPLSSILFFAENVENPSSVVKAQTLIASKVITLLNFIAEKAGRIEKRE